MLVIEEVVGIDDVHARHLDVSLVFFFLMEGDCLRQDYMPDRVLVHA